MNLQNLIMDYYHHNKPTYLGQPCNLQMNRCSSEKLGKKPVDPMYKGSVEGLEYSSLFSSKTYSILSYIVGGFVGSKSQMNNNKHNLSYDLSAAVFNLLNPCKYEREKVSTKKSNDFCNATCKNYPETYEKYIVSKTSQRNEKMKDCLMDVMVLECLGGLPIDEFVSHENYVLAFGEQCMTSVESNKENCSVSNNNNNKNDDMKKQSIPCNAEVIFEKTSNSNPDIISSLDEVNLMKERTMLVELEMKKVNVDMKTQSENLVDQSNSSCDSIENSDKDISVTDSCCLTNNPHSVNYLANERFRQQSECSVESTDSESFIIFDDLSEPGEEKRRGSCFTYEDDSDDENENSDSSSDDYDICSEDLAEANDKWLKTYRNVGQGNTQRKVKFDDNVKINKIVAWDYAYRAARLGPWEQMARDRVRFRERILRLSSVLSPILNEGHRKKIFNKLYS